MHKLTALEVQVQDAITKEKKPHPARAKIPSAFSG